MPALFAFHYYLLHYPTTAFYIRYAVPAVAIPAHCVNKIVRRGGATDVLHCKTKRWFSVPSDILPVVAVDVCWLDCRRSAITGLFWQCSVPLLLWFLLVFFLVRSFHALVCFVYVLLFGLCPYLRAW